MALWKKLVCLPAQNLIELYPPTFPIEARCFLAEWIEKQRWEDFDLEDASHELQALGLLEQILFFLQELARHNPNELEKLCLQNISTIVAMYRSQPLQLVKTIQEILSKERTLLSQMFAPGKSHIPEMDMEPVRDENNVTDVELLFLKVLEIQRCRQEINSIQGKVQQKQYNGVDPQTSQQALILKTHIQRIEFDCQAVSEKHFQLLVEAVCTLDQCQSRLIHKIQTWRWEQHKATIGVPFNDNLGPLKTRCEQLFEVNVKLREEVLIADSGGAEPFRELQERLNLLLQILIQSSLMVNKQPPQVIKTLSKFSTSVLYLLGEKMIPGRPVLLQAQIITESQAWNLVQLGATSIENVGEMINNTAIFKNGKFMCASFQNMSIKKIRRTDRKGIMPVTEEKFALYFSAEILLVGCDAPYRVQAISFPLVVIVHGSQDLSALATIIWDCAFSEPDRLPFVVPDHVPWTRMCMTLNNKFMLEVQTKRGLDPHNLHFMAQKIFNMPDFFGDFSNTLVSWAQFNKVDLPGRAFTFWQWFDGMMELIKKHLKNYWSEGLIFGFIGKQHLHLILQNCPSGTFLLRFSDSEMGGITIAYVASTENGGRKIQNIQPFTKKDLEIRCLGDRIRDIELITHLYPDEPKNRKFQKYYSNEEWTILHGYLKVSMQTKVAK